LIHGWLNEARERRDAAVTVQAGGKVASEPMRAATSGAAGPGLAETATFIITGQRAEGLEREPDGSYSFSDMNGRATIKVRNDARDACEVDLLRFWPGGDELEPNSERYRFARLTGQHGTKEVIVGAFRFTFLDLAGVWATCSLKGTRAEPTETKCIDQITVRVSGDVDAQARVRAVRHLFANFCGRTSSPF
jgi:hypothetical protein